MLPAVLRRLGRSTAGVALGKVRPFSLLLAI